MNSGFLYQTHWALIQGVFLALMLAATAAGFRLGRKAETSIADKTKSQISTVGAALLGILGLLLGFTMSMAVTRFEVRKQLVLEEANAIGTSLLRTQLVPAPEGPAIANLLRQYIRLRVRYGTASDDLAQLVAMRAQGAQLQDAFWTRAAAYGQKDPNPVRAGLLLQSLNQTIDLEAARWMAFHNHVPESVIYVNGIVGLLAVMLVGYAFGLNGRPHIFSMSVLAVGITLVLAVIIDLDRPRSGFIRISQQPMIDLLRQP